jgi:hypothetical protein
MLAGFWTTFWTTTAKATVPTSVGAPSPDHPDGIEYGSLTKYQPAETHSASPRSVPALSLEPPRLDFGRTSARRSEDGGSRTHERFPACRAACAIGAAAQQV